MKNIITKNFLLITHVFCITVRINTMAPDHGEIILRQLDELNDQYGQFLERLDRINAGLEQNNFVLNLILQQLEQRYAYKEVTE